MFHKGHLQRLQTFDVPASLRDGMLCLLPADVLATLGDIAVVLFLEEAQGDVISCVMQTSDQTRNLPTCACNHGHVQFLSLR